VSLSNHRHAELDSASVKAQLPVTCRTTVTLNLIQGLSQYKIYGWCFAAKLRAACRTTVGEHSQTIGKINPQTKTKIPLYILPLIRYNIADI